MGPRELAAIWAQDLRGVIGQDGALPWHLPAEMRHFRETTRGATVVMGRRTWESLPQRFRPLPGRRNVVVSRDAGYAAEGAEVVTSPDDATAIPSVTGTTWVTGGAGIYDALLPHCRRLLVSEVDLDVARTLADRGEDTAILVRAPHIDPSEWRLTSEGPWVPGDPERDENLPTGAPRWRVREYVRR